MPIFVVHSTETHVFNHSTRVFKFVDRHGFTGVCSSSNSRSMHCKTLHVLIAHYVFTRVRHMHYLSSSNSPVNVKIGKRISKGRGLILLVTKPAKLNHLIANYTEFYFHYYISFRIKHSISVSCKRKPMIFYSSD